MRAFWSERARQFGTDPRANTNDVWLREIEIAYVDGLVKAERPSTVLDVGCANGYTTIRLAQLNPGTQFCGIDVNVDMVTAANDAKSAAGVRNLQFELRDLVRDPPGSFYDMAFAIRVFQNVQSKSMQKQLLDAVCSVLSAGRILCYVESYKAGYERLNADRIAMGLVPLPIHPHLTLLTEEFDQHAADRMDFVQQDYPSSAYYLVTRLLYSYIAKMNGDAIDYNHPIHQVGALLPQIGDYGPQRARVYRKRTR